MKYRIDITLEGYIEIEANSKEEAKEIAEDGFAMNQFNCEYDEIGEVSVIK